MNKSEIIKKAKALRSLLEQMASELPDEEAYEQPYAFPAWKVGQLYTINERVRYGEKLYKCILEHTSQDDWTPDVAVSLWVEVSADPIPEWKQPAGAHDAYSKGDKVRHNEKIWVSDIDANVYEPGVYGWTEVA